MSFLENIKGKASDLAHTASEKIGENSETLRQGIEKAGDFVDTKTGGKFAGAVDKAQDAARNAVDKAAEGHDRPDEDPQAPRD